MGLAETARLAVELNLSTTGSFGSATSQLNAVEAAASRGQRGVSRFTGALSHAGSQVKNLVAGPVGIIGLGATLFGLEHVLSGAVEHANEFGEAVSKVSAITGQQAEATSQLVDTLDYYGVTLDKQVALTAMAEKNLGKLTATSEKAAAFAKQYGLSLTDASGHAKTFNQLLLDSADYFNNKSIPAQTKAAALASIYGRNWQQLIPILTKGSSAIKAAEADAISLTSTDLANMEKFKEATRGWNDALGDLSITVGAALLPHLTELAKAATSFVRGHSADIVRFFKDAADWAAGFGKTVGQAAGVVGDLAGAAKGFWDSLPPELRDFLFKGIVADRTVKFLFGVSPIHVVADVAEGVLAKGLSGVLGGFLQKGGSPANPLWVATVNGGLPGPGGPGGPGPLPPGVVLPPIGAVSPAILPLVDREVERFNQYLATRHGPGGTSNPVDIQFQHAAQEIDSSITDLAGKVKDDVVNLHQLTRAVGLEFTNAIHQLQHPQNLQEVRHAATEVQSRVNRGLGSAANTEAALKALKAQLAHTHDPETAKILRAAIRDVEAKLPGRQYAAHMLAKADATLKSHESENQKIRDLQAIEKDLKDHKLNSAAAAIQKKIDDEKRAVVEKHRQEIQAIKDKDLSVNVTVPVTSTAKISINGIMRTVSTRVSFGASALSGGLGVNTPGGGHGG